MNINNDKEEKHEGKKYKKVSKNEQTRGQPGRQMEEGGLARAQIGSLFMACLKALVD